MSEPLSTPFVALPGLTTLGGDAAGFCADGTCEVPDVVTPVPAQPPSGDHDTSGSD